MKRIILLTVLSIFVAGCTSAKYRVKKAFHDHDKDYRTEAKVVAGLKVPKDMDVVSMKPHYVVPTLPQGTQQSTVSLWPPGTQVKQ